MVSKRTDRIALEEEPSGVTGRGDVAAARVSGSRQVFTGVLFVLFVGLTLFNSIDSVARALLSRLTGLSTPVEEAATMASAENNASLSTSFSFLDLDLHPDRLFQPYLAGSLWTGTTGSSVERIRSFRNLLNLYEQRQAVDDNFTIRVIDNRTGELLELYELVSEREKHEQEGKTNWDRIDGIRRLETRRLIEKYSNRGIPRKSITVKWGRRNQVLEARRNEAPFIEYEIRLARQLGLSLLATEIGTVETFNQDRLVSTVGARSRYQMMPYLLRKNGIHHYQLSTASGKKVSVFEEWHPLLTMESAMLTLRGYANAVGHEVPGISAYHTGPGNIYSVYRKFLSQGEDVVSPGATVMDAYIWAVTDGYETVSRGTSFKEYSRGYVPTAYGSLRATEHLPIDVSQTIYAERVQLKPDASLYLSELLDVLESGRNDLTLRGGHVNMDLYDIFRDMNPHISLPEKDDTGIPSNANLRLVGRVEGYPVRFFLPLGASALLARAGKTIIDESATFTFDQNTYIDAGKRERTLWDDQYAQLIKDIEAFGFTAENRKRLLLLENRFEELADANPTHFRRMQLDVIRTHAGIWKTDGWENLANATAAARGLLQAEPMPPVILP